MKTPDIRYLLARLIEAKTPMFYANGDLMGYSSTITFGEDELQNIKKATYK